MMKAMGSSAGERLSVAALDLEVIHWGAGRPVLLLHGMKYSLERMGHLGEIASTVGPLLEREEHHRGRVL